MTRLELLENSLADIDEKYRSRPEYREAYVCARKALCERIETARKEDASNEIPLP